MYGICCVPFLFGKPLVKNTFFKSFPQKRSDCESQKWGFGFDPKIPPREWILWIQKYFKWYEAYACSKLRPPKR